MDKTRLSALADGELTGRDLGATQAHLAACGGCRADLAAFQALRAGVAGLPYAPVRDAEWEQIWSHVSPAIPEGVRLRRREAIFVRLWTWHRPALAMAAAAVILVAGAFVTWRLTRRGEATPAGAGFAVAAQGEARVESLSYDNDEYKTAGVSPRNGAGPVLRMTPRPPISVAGQDDVRVESVGHDSDEYDLSIAKGKGKQGPVLKLRPARHRARV